MTFSISQDHVTMAPGPYTSQCLGYTQITSLAAAEGLATGTLGAIPPSARLALVSVSGAGVRYRDDGVAPTAAIGMPIAAGQEFAYTGDLGAVLFIAQSGSPILDVSFYR